MNSTVAKAVENEKSKIRTVGENRDRPVAKRQFIDSTAAKAVENEKTKAVEEYPITLSASESTVSYGGPSPDNQDRRL